MGSGTTQGRVRKLIVEQCHVEDSKVTPDATLKDMGIDSLESVELIIAIEQEFGVEVSDEESAALDTTAKMAAWLDARIA